MNKTRIFLVFATLLLSGQSFAQTTKATIQGEISSSTANGLLGGTILNNIVLSYVDWTTCSGTGGIVYWNAGIPTCLNAGTNGYTLTMVSGIPQWTLPSSQSASAILDSIGSTEGSVLYRGASTWSALTPGTSGQFLQTNGAGSTPQWATAPGSVSSVNGLTGAVSLAAGAGITVTPSSPNILVAVKDGYTSNTTCTITDQSGASLSITTNYCTVSVTNNIVTVMAQITYPTTATGAYATISLPVAVPNRSNFCGTFSWNGTSLATGGIPCAIKNTSTASFFTSAGTQQTNAGVSGAVYSFTISYPAS